MQATIALTRFHEPDRLLEAALMSLSAQVDIVAEVLLLDQNPSAAIRSRCQKMNLETVRFRYEAIPAKSLSFARNLAIDKAAAPVVLFMDADAVAEPNWALALYDALRTEHVGMVGARILPNWHRRPPLITKSLVVQDQYSIFNLGPQTLPFHRVVGAGFGLHRDRLGREAYFDERLGRREGSLLGGEETELSRRVSALGLDILYAGDAIIRHQIPPERASYGWILRRLFYAGVSRAMIGGSPSPSRAMNLWDFLVLPFVLPPYALGYLFGRRKARALNADKAHVHSR
ncbi:glycosyltransferase [uncultured Thiohalocapsa sp.]|uniref:glycosyltransferase family 2 protein n=1 Tax=uncultured Thiohalocapsa sp. TaxID=768990 RepID=UPI0025D86AE3|nr:glycosyltransferase [uncultured Thiohalocapsa sp.]